ncbi:MAG: L-aspartate oxidase [Clostridia bacterium]|nr:L-aspartate oxidase [Clostridia bacterium]
MLPQYLVNFKLAELPQEETDVLIIGSGIAGLYAALKLSTGYRVMLVTKEEAENGSTELAQGGIAAALGENDSPAAHFEDTLRAGAGLCDRDAVAVLVEEGPRRVRELIELGVPFDREDGKLALGREGAHSRRRIVHAGGDATGDVIWRCLAARAWQEPRITVRQGVMALDLLVADKRCYGALVWEGASNRIKAVFAGATVLASGGAGRLFPVTTNPPVATGDGLAMAYRCGAEVVDLEFFQFHPTVLAHPAAGGFLISEAVRGEGAVLRNSRGERFMPAYHPLAELAPRDIVSRAISAEMERHKAAHVFLDLTTIQPAVLERRFPRIVAACRKLGLEPTRDWVPVAPAAHYFMGGVRTDVWGRTNIDGLYACGEVACTGVHGANRLASNSLLEGVVFSARIAEFLLGESPLRRPQRVPPFIFQGLKEGGLEKRADLSWLQRLVQEKVGLCRNGPELQDCLRELEVRLNDLGLAADSRTAAAWANLLTVAWLMARAAAWRQESRGAHYRLDFPASRPEWVKRLVLSREEGIKEVKVNA